MASSCVLNILKIIPDSVNTVYWFDILHFMTRNILFCPYFCEVSQVNNPIKPTIPTKPTHINAYPSKIPNAILELDISIYPLVKICYYCANQ